MAFLNESGLVKLWGKIKTLVGDTQGALQENIDKKLNTDIYTAQMNAGVKNPHALKVKVNNDTASYDYDGSAEKSLAIKAGENITISRSEGVITIASSGELTGTIENAVKAEKDASGNVITTTYATKAEVNALNTDVIAPIGTKADANATNISALQTDVSKAQGDATQALADAAAADGKAVAAQNDATQALADAAAADGKAVAAQTAADAAQAHSNGVAGDLSTEITNRTNSDNALSGRISTLEGQITGLTGAMHFKGEVNTDPTGITSGYNNGDVVIFNNKEYVFHGDESKFVELGDTTAELTEINSLKANKVDKTTTVTAGTGLSGGGALSGNITINHSNTITAGTASGTATSSIDLGGSFDIPSITYDAQGHITNKNTTKITLKTDKLDAVSTKADNAQARANAGITNIVIPQIESKDVATVAVSEAGNSRTATITFVAIDENHSIWATLT